MLKWLPHCRMLFSSAELSHTLSWRNVSALFHFYRPLSDLHLVVFCLVFWEGIKFCIQSMPPVTHEEKRISLKNLWSLDFQELKMNSGLQYQSSADFSRPKLTKLKAVSGHQKCSYSCPWFSKVLIKHWRSQGSPVYCPKFTGKIFKPWATFQSNVEKMPPFFTSFYNS